MGDLAEVVAAVHETLASSDGLSERQRVSLLAWPRAWASDWPTSFAGAFGSRANDVLAAAAAGIDASGQYLKLRRLAREHLAHLL